ncbi:hypothetical protein [Novipirellula aureliae]|nr:hypothetical protein [Novipirellula aureliae]
MNTLCWLLSAACLLTMASSVNAAEKRAEVTDEHPIFNPKCMAVMEEIRKEIRGK